MSAHTTGEKEEKKTYISISGGLHDDTLDGLYRKLFQLSNFVALVVVDAKIRAAAIAHTTRGTENLAKVLGISVGNIQRRREAPARPRHTGSSNQGVGSSMIDFLALGIHRVMYNCFVHAARA